MNELADILVRSEQTTNPNDFCAYTNWGGRVHKDDGTYYGEDVFVNQPTTNADGSFVSGGSVYYVSDGSVIYSAISGSITSYNPCYRTFTPEDHARIIEILQQWTEIQEEYNMSQYGSVTDESPSIGATVPGSLTDATPAG